MIKSIDTFYKGNYFRSRLEARWAVFFDLLNVRYEYEKEGFDLHYCGKYLPDFYIHGYDCFIEIKPMITHNGFFCIKDNDPLLKCQELSMATKKDVLLIYGTAIDHKAWFYADGTLEWCRKRFYFSKDEDDGSLFVSPDFCVGDYEPCYNCYGAKVEESSYYHYKEAVKACQTRFEYKSF